MSVKYECAVKFLLQRFGMDTAGDTQMLRDEFHELENQYTLLQRELSETTQQLREEKHNSEIVRQLSLYYRRLSLSLQRSEIGM